jgi:general secretion pathway protein D
MRIIKASLVSYLVAMTAYGPWALAQPRIVPVPAAPLPTERQVTAAQAPTSPTTEKAGAPARQKKAPLSRKWKLAPNAAAPATPATPAAAPGAAPAPAAPAPAGAAPAAPGGSSTGMVEYPGEKEFNSCKKLPAGKAILKLNMKPDTEIGDLIGWLSSITCTPFLIPSTVGIAGKKVTVIAPQAMTPGEAYRLFYAALESVGLTVEPSGRFLRIVDTGRARMTKLPYYGDHDAIPRDKRFITKLVRVENLDPTELVNSVLNRIKGETGDIIAYRASLIITDTAENVERMVEIVKDFDIPSAFAESLWIIRVKNMSATEMASRLAEIVPVQQVGGARRAGGPAPPPAPAAPGKGAASALPGDLNAEMTINKIVPDERSNSLLVVANQRAYDWLLTIVRKLDQPLDTGEGASDGKVHVYYCENANCDELAATLSAVAGVSVVGGVGGGRRTRTSTPGAPPPPPVPQAVPGQQQGASSMLFEGDVRITFDAPTNSLLVVSSLKDFQALRKVIERLDAPRKQVFIEALILEVSLDKTRETGVAYHGGGGLNFPGNDTSLLLGGFEASKTLNPASLVSNLGGLTGALFGPTIPAQQVQVFGTAVQLPSFGVFLQLLQTNNDVNVLSNPSLLITNNQEGEISVGENLPFPGQLLGGFGGFGSASAGQQGLGGFGIPSVGVQRQDVALKMKLVPSVNEHNVIRLDVDQEISDVSAPNFNGLGPATSKRAAKTTVVARDQQTVVIGGLMTDRASETVKKVPILGDIPVIGFFFRSTTKTTAKKNIIIAITPYVISDLSDLRRVAEKKLKERREFIERYSALEDKMQYEANIDYRRKRGMLEEINRTARELEQEEEEMRLIRARNSIDESVQLAPPSRRPSGMAPRVPVSTNLAPATPAPTPRAVVPSAPPPVAPAPVPEGAPAPAPAPTTPPPAPPANP